MPLRQFQGLRQPLRRWRRFLDRKFHQSGRQVWEADGKRHRPPEAPPSITRHKGDVCHMPIATETQLARILRVLASVQSHSGR